MKQIYFLLILTSFLQSCNTTSKSENKLPEPGAYVEDFEGVLVYDSGNENWTYNHLAILDSTIAEFEHRTGNEIAVITVSDIKPYATLKEYATAIGNQWGVGKKKENNGLVIAVSSTRREIWIATGRGTEKIITDSICQDIINQQMLPEFKNGKVFGGIQKGLTTIIDIWSSHSQP